MKTAVDLHRGENLRGHTRAMFNRCLQCKQKVEHHKDGVNVGVGLVHVKSCARRWRKAQRKEERHGCTD